MQRLATACEAIAATTKKLLKTGIVADYLKSRTTDEAAVSAVFLSGRAFPAWEETRSRSAVARCGRSWPSCQEKTKPT